MSSKRIIWGVRLSIKLILAGTILYIILTSPLAGTAYQNFLLKACDGFGFEKHGATNLSGSAELVPFEKNDYLTFEDYRGLFEYFVNGFYRYRSPLGALAYYPGANSKHPKVVDSLEGFARIAPLMAVGINGGLLGKDTNALVRSLKEGFISGTDPNSVEYWGKIGDFDQRIVEAADIALALWLSRDWVWVNLASPERDNILRWLGEARNHKVHDNNWHLFVVMIDLVMAGLQGDKPDAEEHFSRVFEFYNGDGWFRDGLKGGYDYYNAWGFNYSLFWISRISPEFHAEKIRAAITNFARDYKYFIGTQGIPIVGRSVCYRLAAPAPLLADYISGADQVNAGQAKRSLDAVWRYFIRTGAVKDGAITQGYCGTDIQVLDNYSGPASCLWSLRSLIIAMSIDQGDPFWTARGRLPVEIADYNFNVSNIGWRIVGEKDSQEIKLINEKGGGIRNVRRSIFTSIKACYGGKRPEIDKAAQYERQYYSSKSPYCGCTD